jgi:hypothetical protein
MSLDGGNRSSAVSQSSSATKIARLGNPSARPSKLSRRWQANDLNCALGYIPAATRSGRRPEHDQSNLVLITFLGCLTSHDQVLCSQLRGVTQNPWIKTMVSGFIGSLRAPLVRRATRVLSCSLWVSVMPCGPPGRSASDPLGPASTRPTSGERGLIRWSSVHLAAKQTDRMDHLRAPLAGALGRQTRESPCLRHQIPSDDRSPTRP